MSRADRQRQGYNKKLPGCSLSRLQCNLYHLSVCMAVLDEFIFFVIIIYIFIQTPISNQYLDIFSYKIQLEGFGVEERSLLILGVKIKLPRQIIEGNRVSLTFCDITCVYKVKSLLVPLLLFSIFSLQ